MTDLIHPIVYDFAQTINQPSLIVDDQHCLHFANDAFCQYFQVPLTQLQGKPLSEINDGEWNIPQLLEALDTVISGNTSTLKLSLHQHFQTVGLLSLSLNVRCISTDQPKIIALVFDGSTAEMTHLKRSQDALRESEARFQQLADNVHAAFWVFDLRQHQMAYASPAHREIVGIPPESLYEDAFAWLKNIHPADVDTVQMRLSRAQESEPNEFEFRYLHPAGELRWIRSRAFPVRNQDGQINLMAGITEDITERRQTEEALRYSEERFSKVYDASPVPIAITFLDSGEIIDANARFLQLVGYSLGEIIGTTPAEIGFWTQPNDAAYVTSLLRQQGSIRDLEREIYTKSGTKRVVLVSAEIIVIGGKECVLLLLYDITGRKEAEQQALELALEREKVAMMEMFINDASHDLRTPITILRSSTYLIKRHAEMLAQKISDLDTQLAAPGTEKGQKLLAEIAGIGQSIRHSVNTLETGNLRMEYLIETLLQMERLEKQPDFEFTPRDLNAIVSDFVDMYGTQAPIRGLRLESQLDNTIPLVSLDEREFSRVLQNVLENAFNYTPSGGLVTVRTWAEGQHIVLEVRDTGVGITPENLERIFDRFFRADKARSRHSGGMGLGLAIVQKIVAAHQGQIEVQSAPRVGTTFRIRLPAR